MFICNPHLKSNYHFYECYLVTLAMLQYENSRFISYFDLMKLKLNFCPLCEAVANNAQLVKADV